MKSIGCGFDGRWKKLAGFQITMLNKRGLKDNIKGINFKTSLYSLYFSPSYRVGHICNLLRSVIQSTWRGGGIFTSYSNLAAKMGDIQRGQHKRKYMQFLEHECPLEL
jgi:hypothetical protein